MACTQINDRRAETKAVKTALKAAGINAKVGHGTGTAWGWLYIEIGNQRQNLGEHDGREGRGDCSANCAACNLHRALRDETIKIAQETTGRSGDYNGDINVHMQEEIDQSEWLTRRLDSWPVNETATVIEMPRPEQKRAEEIALSPEAIAKTDRLVAERETEHAATATYRAHEKAAQKAMRAILSSMQAESAGRKNWGDTGSMGYIAMELERVAATLGCDGYEQD